MAVDFHVHLTAWGNVPQADRQAYVESFPKCLDAAGLDRAVIFALDNELVARTVAKARDRLTAFAFLDPRRPETPDRLERYVKEHGFRGLKMSTSGGPIEDHGFYPNEAACAPTFARAQELGVPVLVHAGLIYCNPDDPGGTRTKYCLPIYLDDVAREFPNLKLVVAHGGRPFVEQTIALSLMPSVYVDVSWSLLPLTMWPDLIRQLLEAFGPDRVIYGSDANWREPSRLRTRLEECRRILREVLKVDAATEAKVLGANAERLVDGDPAWRIVTEAIRTQ
ncbi:MAG: amidohydrolase family protein [Candidatus Rokuibacteriota bacterium]